jgi:hypothetical protein
LIVGHALVCRSSQDFGLFKGTKVDFEDTWKDCPLFGEVGAEKWMNAQGLRYRMRRTPEEEKEIAPLGPDIKIGPFELKVSGLLV